MEDIGHSPLLKLVSDSNTPTMSKPEFKIQVPLGDSKITSTVIGEQKLRENVSESYFANVPEDNTTEDATGIDEDSSKTPKFEKREEKLVETKTREAELTMEDCKDFVLSPVITVTKEEAALTKGDLKLQKVTVSEDISDTKTATLEEQISVSNGEPDIQTEVLNMQKIRNETQNDEKDKTESKKPKTRIPTLRFRQAVDQLKQSRKSFDDKKEPETPQPTPRSAIPRLKDNRSLTSSFATQQKETINALPRLSDEFDKLYDEIAEDQDSLDNLSLSSRIEDPVKLENTFEEIIHAYEEDKIQPINVEKAKQSKIPLLKRKSEHEIEVPKQTSPVFKQSVSVDFSKIKSSEIIPENNSKIQSATLNKTPIRTSLISKRISEMKSVEESSIGYFEKISTVNVPTTEKSSTYTKPNIIKKEIVKEVLNQSPNVSENKENISKTEQKKTSTTTMPISDHTNESIKSQMKDNGAKSVEKQNIFTQKEQEKSINSVTSTKTTINEFDNDLTQNLSTRGTGHKNEEDIPVLRGKVNRIIQRMDSKETEVMKSKRDFGDRKRKEKSVLSKIALFEHSKTSDDETPTARNLCNARSSNIKPAEPIETNLESSNNKPKIVEEVLKALPTKDVEENNEIDIKNNFNKLKTIHGYNNVPTTVDDRKDNEYAHHNKLTGIQLQIDTQYNGSVEPVEIAVLNTDDFRPTQVNSESSSLTAVYNNQNAIEDNQSPILNINGSKHDIQETVSRKSYDEKGAWKSEHNIIQDNQYNSTFNDKFNENKPITTNGKPEITSDIIKQEVKFERMKTNDEEKIKENEDVFHKNTRKDEGQLRINSYRNNKSDKITKSSSLAELDLGLAVQGRVKNIIVRMKSLDRLDTGKKEIIDARERPRKKSVSEKIALFERKLTPIKLDKNQTPKTEPKAVLQKCDLSEEEYVKKIEELSLAKTRYGALDPGKMKYLELRDGGKMPAIGIGTALLDPKLTRYIIQAAIDLGYRTIDTAYIYGNEKEVGEAINEKIKDGTVTRSELFIISKLWSTFHRQDLVERACRASLDAIGLDYFDLYLIHNPMSFKEGGDPIPRIASVIQFSEHDYLDAWYGVEKLVRAGLVRRGGLSNFNSQQVDRVVEKGKIKPVVNQVECHPYLSQNRLDDFCQARHVKLCCFGVLGSKGTPLEYKSALPPAIDDPLVRVMAAGLDVSPAALLISYQLALDRGVIVKASNPARLWDNLQALALAPSSADVSALHALNRNKRTFTFKGMGDTHRNYPFNIPF